MLKTILIILTLGQGGAMQLALTETDSLEDCMARADVVGQILSGAGEQIEAMRCGETDLAVSPYEHGHGPEDLKWHYLVSVKGTSLEDGFDIRPVEAGHCDASAGKVCAISAQRPLPQ
ncbi:hypothetical protein [Marivita sp. S2033]|uniref:hypothetical protein n=1 Tax=Marivita sp. S2033 TaxID=3373187 RepID=UPI003981B9F8